MTASIYPSTLPNPSVSSVTTAERRLLSDVTGGPQQARGVQRDYLSSQHVEWALLSAADASTLDTWWKTTLTYGGAWFASVWPAPQGWVSVVRRFIGAPRWTHLPGGFWRVSADMQIKGVGLAPYISDTVLLMHFDGINGSTTMVDAKGHNAYLYHIAGWPAESASISTTSPIMGSGSLLCSPYQTAASFSNIVCAIDSSADFDLPGAFTIEFSQIGPASTATAAIPMCRTETNPNTGIINTQWSFRVLSGFISFNCLNQDGTARSVQSAYSASVLQRYAVTRDTSNNLRLYIEGTLVATTPGVDSTMTGTSRISINGPYQTSNPIPNNWSSGKYDEIRITKGIALYTGSSYALATAPFTG